MAFKGSRNGGFWKALNTCSLYKNGRLHKCFVVDAAIVALKMSQHRRHSQCFWKYAMKNNPFWVLADGIFVGLSYAVIILVIGAMEAGPLADDLFLRAFFGFVFGVCSKSALDGAVIELASDTPPRFGRYHYGWAMGSMWGMAMILASWPLNPPQVAVWIGAGVFFGMFMALQYKPTKIPPARLDLYDSSKNIYDVWHPLWRVGPNLFLVCLFGALLFMIADEADESVQSPYLVFGMAAALINNSAPYLYRHRGLKALRLLGPITIIVGYLAL